MEYNYSKEQLLDMYYHLKRGRIFTLKMHECVSKGYLRSSFHTPYGQESIGVGIVSAMRKTDWLSFTHRLQTALIMRYDLYPFIAELFGTKDGIGYGSVFDYHCSDYEENRIMTILGTLGGVVPTNTGFAWGLKKQGKDEVAVIVHGDGGCSEGTVYEGWNLAALHKVPAVYVIENNEWAMTVPIERQTVNPTISDKAIPFGLSRQVVDGTDILAVRHAMDIAIEKARNFEPNVVEMKALRWEAHFVGQGNDYRNDKEKIEEYKKYHDPVTKYEKYLIERNLIDQAYIDNLAEAFTKEIDGYIEKASNAGKVEFEKVYAKGNIYANPETGGDL